MPLGGFASEFLDMCVQTIVWEPMVARDAYGQPLYGAPTSYRGRRVYKFTRVPSKGGDPDDLSESTIWVLGLPDVDYEDRLYVQGDLPPHPVIMSILRYPDETGDQFVKV